MRLFQLALLPALALPAAALGQPTCASGEPPGAGGAPILHLTATATVKVAPDELWADLEATATSPSAVAAQRRVNDLMARAKAIAVVVATVTFAFREYSTSFVDEKPIHWLASQTLELKGRQGSPLLDLTARLQATGLTIGDLSWHVADETAETARHEATLEALKKLRDEAGSAAGALGLEVDRFQSIDLTGAPVPLPLPRMGVAMAAVAPMQPPEATPETQDVIATVAADAMLRPARAPGKAQP